MRAEVLMKRKMHFTRCAYADFIPARSLQRTKPFLPFAPIVRGRAGHPRANAGAHAASPAGGWGAGTLCPHPAGLGGHWLALILCPTPRGS